MYPVSWGIWEGTAADPVRRHSAFTDGRGHYEIPDLTPDGSNEDPSEALPIIWQEWDGYVESAELLAIEGGKLVEIASNGAEQRAAKIQFAKVSKTCGTCHEKYRKPKEDKQS